MEFIFWLCVGFVFYAYIGYPGLLLLWARFRRRPVKKAYIEPMVSIIVAVHNEERIIMRKIQNLLSLDYTGDKFEIIIISDGSTDRTNKVVSEYEAKGIRFYHYEGRKGKAFALNLGISHARGEIIFFTDARQILERDSLRELVANFNDSSVAVVSGELILSVNRESRVSKDIGLYWKIEKWMRTKESQVGSVLGATGSIYAIRKNEVKPIPSQTVLDDLLIPFRAILNGHRSIFEPKARALDEACEDIRVEFKRKIRTLSGNYQLFVLEPSLLNPLKNPIFFQFVSHKVARLMVPFAMIVVLICSCFLSSPIYRGLLFLQIVFYVLALSAKWGPNNFLGNLMKSFNTILMMNLAAFVGLFKFFTNPQKIQWEKT